MVTNIFMGYDSEPPVIRDTLHRTCRRLNEMRDFAVVSWEDLTVAGHLIITRITHAIDAADLSLFDLTTINPNVLFELGYAIAKGKQVLILCEADNTSFATLFKKFGLLRGVGYTSWYDSNSLAATISYNGFEQQPSQSPLGDELVQAAGHYDESSLFFLPARNRSDPDTEVRAEVLRLADSGISVVTADPDEARLEPFSWYAAKAYSSAACLLHFESPRRTDHRLHNARIALIGGLAHGFDRKILMQSDSEYDVPIDYESFMRQYTTASEAGGDAAQWLKSLQLPPTQTRRHPRLSLGVELGDLNFGEHVAENEVMQLPDYFIETAEYREVKSAHLCVFVGRKGTGKSANLFLAAADLRGDPDNLVIVVRPAAYDFAGLVEMMAGLSTSSRQHTVEGIWKLLLLTEIARGLTGEIRARATHTNKSTAEEAFLRGLESAPFDLDADFGARVSATLRSLSGLNLGEIPQQQRPEVLNGALHAEWISRLRKLLAPLLARRRKISILIDNLDKGWDKSADLAVLSDILLGLLVAVGRVESDLTNAIRNKPIPPISLALFLRSDIFSYVRERAREPDKILTSTVKWDDQTVLRRVVEERFLSSRPEGTDAAELWSNFFCPKVKGLATVEYLLSRVLPRPRDLIFLCNAAVGIAINRRHSQIDADDILAAEEAYSQFAFEALLVENGITVADFESLLFEFLGSSAILQKAEVFRILSGSGFDGIAAENAFQRLKAVSFLGIEVSNGQFEFPEVGRAMERAEVRARKHALNESATLHVIHPAYRRFLEISDPE